MIQGSWLRDSLGCLVCVFWVLAASRVWCGGCRVREVCHRGHGISVHSEANQTASGLSVAVFCFSWSSLYNLQCLC